MQQKAFLDLLEPLKPGLFGFACRMLGNAEDARDTLQELSYRMWKMRKKLNDQKNIKAYCFTIMHHLCIDEIRRRNRHLRLEEPQDDIPNQRINNNGAVIAETGVGMNPEISDLVSHIRAEVKKLPYKQRVTIELHDFQEFSPEEVAGILDMEVNAVRVNLSRARAKLAEKFQKEIHHETR